MRKNLHWNSKIYDKYIYLIIIDKVLMRSSWTLMCLKSSEYLWILCERCFSEGSWCGAAHTERTPWAAYGMECPMGRNRTNHNKSNKYFF